MKKVLIMLIMSTLCINAETLTFETQQKMKKLILGKEFLEINYKENVVSQQHTGHNSIPNKSGILFKPKEHLKIN